MMTPPETIVDSLYDLNALDASTIRPSLRLHEALSPEEISQMAQSQGLLYIQALEIDCAHANEQLIELLQSPLLTQVDTLRIKTCHWGEYYTDCSPYGWEPDALSPALDELSKHSALTRMEFLGTLPSHSSDEYNGTMGFVGISDWLKGIKHLVVDTPEFNDETMGIFVSYQVFEKLEALSIHSPSITDNTASSALHVRFKGPLKAFELRGYLISHDAWDALSRAADFPSDARERFAQRAQQGPKSWNDLFGDVRALLQTSLDETQFGLVVDQLTKLQSTSLRRYNAEIIPYISALPREIWNMPVEIEFGYDEHVYHMEHIHTLAPFLTFHVITADSSWSGARWPVLGHSHVLERVRVIESYNHGWAAHDFEALLSSDGIAKLETLYILQSHDEQPDGFLLLASSDKLASLKHLTLNLSFGTPGLPIAQALVRAPWLAQLETLSFDAGDREQWEPLLTPLASFKP